MNISRLPHACYIPRPAHPLQFNHCLLSIYFLNLQLERWKTWILKVANVDTYLYEIWGLHGDSGRGLLGSDVMQWYGRMKSNFWENLAVSNLWRWWQQVPPKWRYPTSLQGVKTWRRRQDSRPKHWCPTTSLYDEDGAIMVIRNVCILHHYKESKLEDGGKIVVRNIGILPHHYMGSQPRRPEHAHLCGTKFEDMN